MDNHVHLLVKVPRAPATPLTDQELLSRLQGLSGTGGSKATRQQLTSFRERNQPEAAEALRKLILARMWDMSGFMKLLKQRFSQWFGRRRKDGARRLRGVESESLYALRDLKRDVIGGVETHAA